MSLIRVLVWSIVAAAALVTAGIWLAARNLPPAVMHGYGVISPCGFYGVIVVWSDGTSTFYDHANPVPEDLMNQLNANDTMRTGIAVPCPTTARPMQQSYRSIIA